MDALDALGWELVPGVFTPERVNQLLQSLQVLADETSESVRHRDGAVYAARNVLRLIPDLPNLWKTPLLVRRLESFLGDRCGLVRALFFDKPPEQTWALPWHKDLKIAVADGSATRDGYSKPRPRAGVLHTEPPLEVLESMLTIRIHLDPMTDANGCLQVLSGSHRTGKTLQIDGFRKQAVHSRAGDVLLMRPLLVHASGRSAVDCRQHRRVLHLEFAASETLPEGMQWATFLPVIA